MVKAAVLANNNNDMLDRGSGSDPFDRVLPAIVIVPFFGARSWRKRKRGD
jgi:hypothetical protein